MIQAAVIANPFAGPAQGRLPAHRAVALLEQRGLAVRLLATTGPGHATLLATEAAGWADLVVALGGDGTVHETAAGLAGTGCPLGVLPSGSGNDFAQGIGCPGIAEGLAAITGGRVLACDTGRLDGAFFANSVGLLASGLVSLRAAGLWRRLGRRRYLLASLGTLLTYRGQDVTWTITGQGPDFTARGRFLLAEICNGPSTGGGFRFAPGAAFDDGQLDACLIRPVGLVAALRLLGPAARGEALDHPAISLVQGTRIVFSSDREMGYHRDGEPGLLPAGEHVIELDRGNLNVLVP